MRSFYGRGFIIQETAHPFLPITLHHKRCPYVQYSTVLFKFTIKLLVIFKLLCFIYSSKNGFILQCTGYSAEVGKVWLAGRMRPLRAFCAARKHF